MPSKNEILDLIYPEFAGKPNRDEMFHLYGELGLKAAQWRGTQPSDETDAPLHLEVVQEYHQLFQKLTDMGWDWRHIDVESMLPDALMPEVVYQAHSVDELMQSLLAEVRHWHQKKARPTIALYSFDKAYTRLLELGFDPESILKPQNERISNVIWFGIPLSPEKYYERHPEQSRPKQVR